MEKRFIGSRILLAVRSVFIAAVSTALLLLLLSFLLFRLDLNEGQVAFGILVVYVLSCFIGGFAAGKGAGSRKFLWGLLTGGLYFVILMILSVSMGKFGGEVLSLVTTGTLCLGGGMLGGMLA